MKQKHNDIPSLSFVLSTKLKCCHVTGKEVILRSVTLLVEVCLDPSVHLPTFCAVNSARMRISVLFLQNCVHLVVKSELLLSYVVK